MKIGIFPGYSNDPRVKEAITSFIKGLQYLGEEWVISYDHENAGSICDVAVIWGISSLRFPHTVYRDIVRQNQYHTLIIERGFIKRDEYYSIGWWDTSGYGSYYSPVKHDRWEKLGVKLHPWRIKPNGWPLGMNILICGQVPHDTSVQHTNHRQWIDETIKEIRRITARPIVVRPHPLAPSTYDIAGLENLGVSYSNNSLEDDLSNAHAVITFNSTVGVDAFLAGNWVFSFDKRSMVYQVSSHNIELLKRKPILPTEYERQNWAKQIAYSQWTLDEIRKGEPWLHLKQLPSLSHFLQRTPGMNRKQKSD